MEKDKKDKSLEELVNEDKNNRIAQRKTKHRDDDDRG